jgi:formate dehydrogenase iron-sulfur subunit
MSSAQPLHLPIVDDDSGRPRAAARVSLIDQLLREQQDLSAVERFSLMHDAGEHDAQAPFYRSLLPASPPAPGEQYAFEVDLDQCTGCKACVTACHSLNGLDESETWRSVGLLHGGTVTAAVQQTVTTSCHHCVDPACMNGCPVQAYEKDPKTGIVRHLDDQCIGCQYCIFACPYEVPQFNAAKGIVRKCDMCHDRLAVGEAPACVQACPNEAIAIRVVSTASVLEDVQSDQFLPGAPSPGITVPTTSYKSAKPLPRNMLPADFYSVRPAHQHVPLVVMLVLTQLSVGAFCVEQILGRTVDAATLAAVRPIHSAVALALGLVALAASTLHLGRPLYAFRVVLGLRTSWLSREILAFGFFALLATLYAGAAWQAENPSVLADWPQLARWADQTVDRLGALVALFGIAGVGCSVMLYHVTRRTWWAAHRTGFKFFLTAGVLGLATTATTMAFARAAYGGMVPDEAARLSTLLAWVLAALVTVKLLGEAALFVHLRDKQHGDLKRSAKLLTGDLAKQTYGRFAAGVAGGIVIPLVFLATAEPGSSTPACVGATLSLLLLTLGELVERTSFFSALSAPRMPGGLR